MSNELVTIDETNEERLKELFSPNGLDCLYDTIKNEVSSLVVDLESEEGRSQIASTAYKVARSKTYIDNHGKNFVSKIKKQSKAIDAERKRMKDRLDELRDEIRQPLNEWEANEKRRVDTYLANIEFISSKGSAHYSDSEHIKSAIDVINAIPFSKDNWEEYLDDAVYAKDTSLKSLEERYKTQLQYEVDQAELKELREKRAEQERKDNEARILKEASDKAERDAKAKIEAERQAKEKAERDKMLAQEQAERDKIAAAEKAERDKQAAVEAERLRLEQIEQNKIKAEASRKANEEHLRNYNNAAVLDLMNHTKLSTEQAKSVITAIIKDKISHVIIHY